MKPCCFDCDFSAFCLPLKCVLSADIIRCVMIRYGITLREAVSETANWLPESCPVLCKSGILSRYRRGYKEEQ